MPPRDTTLSRAAVAPVQVIAVSGGKGGTGKTSVAVNLATAMAQAGQRAMLLDGDLGLANADVLLGLTPRYTLEHVLRGERRLEEIILETAAGLRVVPAASGIARMAALSSAEQSGIVQAFSALPGALDVLVVDTATGIGEPVLRFCQAAQQVLIVLRDEPASLTDAYALIKVLHRQRGLRCFRVVANMTRAAAHGTSVFQRLQRVADRYLDVVLDYAGEIPEDASLKRSVQLQRSVLEAFPVSVSAQAFKRLARVAGAWPVASGASGRLEFFFERLVLRRAPQLRAVT